MLRQQTFVQFYIALYWRSVYLLSVQVRFFLCVHPSHKCIGNWYHVHHPSFASDKAFSNLSQPHIPFSVIDGGRVDHGNYISPVVLMQSMRSTVLHTGNFRWHTQNSNEIGHENWPCPCKIMPLSYVISWPGCSNLNTIRYTTLKSDNCITVINCWFTSDNERTIATKSVVQAE